MTTTTMTTTTISTTTAAVGTNAEISRHQAVTLPLADVRSGGSGNATRRNNARLKATQRNTNAHVDHGVVEDAGRGK
jgi:hypothetical protein